MSVCLRITALVGVKDGFLRSFLKKQAEKLEVEGVAQFIDPEKVQIVICGKRDIVDQYVDIIHQGAGKYQLDSIELEPFVRTKDYRGIFRVIE